MCSGVECIGWRKMGLGGDGLRVQGEGVVMEVVGYGDGWRRAGIISS